ncbi:AMP-binding protein [Zavarzinia sp. CC-PAN008]|uniref:AMP-binding protein n=1 Tax=Zavarzinia sp. CC-PAN008 TaxID=3243332 RepID=UPI003F743114
MSSTAPGTTPAPIALSGPDPFAGSATVVPMGQIPAWHARRDPNRPMVTQDGVTYSRSELEARANRRARMLQAQGVGQGDFVTLALPNSLEFFETAFAIWKLGATPNPVSARLPDSELSAIVELVRPRVVIGPDPARLPGFQVQPAGRPIDESLSPEALPEAIAPSWKAMTSGGSTGRPKVIVDSLPSQWDPTALAVHQQADDTLLNPGPLYHNGPFALGMMGLFAGGHMVNMARFDPLKTLELVEQYKVGWLYTVPTMLHRIWKLPEEQRNQFDLSSLHTVFHVAAACPVWLKQAWIDWLGPSRIFEIYGGTERQGSTAITGEEWLEHKGSVGKIQPGSTLAILDPEGKPLPPGEVGEIYFLPDGGLGSTYRYIGAEGRIKGDWESIGDLGYLDKDDYLYLVDRRTDLIISGGANIYPAEVEAALDAHPDVQSSVAVGLPDDDLGHRVHAVVQLLPQGQGRVTPEDLIAFAESRLVRYKVPRSIEIVDEQLRDDAGKVRRSAIREAATARARAEAAR